MRARDIRTAFCALLCASMSATNAIAALNVVIVEGLAGEEIYKEQFAAQVDATRAAGESLTEDNRVQIFRSDAVTREHVVAHFEMLSSELSESDQVIVFLIGHGSFDDHEYKFNIPGPDLTDADIVTALGGLPTSNVVLINTSSASGAASELWEAENRVVITATRSGSERHATKFGIFFAESLSDSAADVDKNEIISAREAFDYAERRVADYFDENGQLATEHPRIEGGRADRFSLARLGGAKSVSEDSALRELVAERDLIATDIDELRLARDGMDLEDYQQQLLQRMLDLATAEEAIEKREEELGRAQ